jgi:DNA-binding transcriptional MerR regulator
MSPLPPKLYFRIGEVASLVGVEPHVLRYWEREFRSIRPTKSAKGQRVYSRRDVENLMRVRELLYGQGFTIAGAKKKLQKNGVEPDVAAEREAQVVTDACAEPEIGVAELVSAVPPSRDTARMRDALLELRGEIESLLADLDQTLAPSVER